MKLTPSKLHWAIQAAIILAVLFVFLLLIVPHFMGPGRQPTVEEIGENQIQRLRNAVEQFRADTGVFPGTLRDLVAPDAAALTVKVVPERYKGPYLSPKGGIVGTGIPKIPLVENDEAIDHHWTYNPHTGRMTSAVGVGWD